MRYCSRVTGEVVESLRAVIKTIIEDYRYFKIWNIRWYKYV